MMPEKRLTRRDFFKVSAVTAVSAAGAGLLACGGDAVRGRVAPESVIKKLPGFEGGRSNIILILCDDLGQGDPGCYGNRSIRTPNIDSIARDGVRFTDAYASSSLCTPSRIGLLTGRYAVRSGLTFPLQSGSQPLVAKMLQKAGRAIGRLGAMDLSYPSSVDGIPAAEITIADALKLAGYRTGMIGKWHLGDFSKEPEYHPMRHGFDEFFGTPMTNDELPNPLYRNETMLERDIGLNQARLTGLSAKEAIAFMERNRAKQPFFLYMAFHAPHLPLYASEQFKGKSAAGIYGDVVEEIDSNVGKILSFLKEKGLADNTLVIFTSDNGPWYEGRPGPECRGRKGQSYEGGYQVPLAARWPGRIPAGSLCGEATMNIDMFPTLLELAGLGLPSDRIIDGKSIAGLLLGTESASPHEALFLYHHEQLEGVRAGKWKYFRNINHYAWPAPLDKPATPLGSVARDRFLGQWPNLYNLETDRGENYDLASTYPEVCRSMEAMMAGWEKELAVNPGGWR